MTYAIGYFVFGAIVPEQSLDEFGDDVLYADGDFDRYYSGSGDEPATWFGIELAQIDECTDLDESGVDKLVIQMRPTRTIIEQFQQKQARALAHPDIPESAKEWIKQIRPGVFLTWGTS